MRRGLTVLAVAAASATLVGFVMGTRRAPEPAGYAAPRLDRPRDLQPAPTYSVLASGRASPNRLRQPQNLGLLVDTKVENAARDPAAWQAAVARRSERRAYDGAPPVIPHAVDQRAQPNCSGCHERHLRIGDRAAPPPSHEAKASCVQCHVVASSPVPIMPGLPDQPPLANAFSGLESAGKGTRAWPGAPPVIPHSTRMRERCASCHGFERPALVAHRPAELYAVSRAVRTTRSTRSPRQGHGGAMTVKLTRRMLFGLRAPEPARSSREPMRPAPKSLKLIAQIQPFDCLAQRGQVCTVCAERCPVPGAVHIEGARVRIDAGLCTGCGTCQQVCPAPQNAIVLWPDPSGSAP
jgi:cytochrome c-type protein NapB